MTVNDEQYVPSDEDVRSVWVVHERDCGWEPHPGDPSAEFDRFLARVRRDAWTEGCRAAEQYYKRTVVGVPGSDPIPAPVNPHEETP